MESRKAYAKIAEEVDYAIMGSGKAYAKTKFNSSSSSSSTSSSSSSFVCQIACAPVDYLKN